MKPRSSPMRPADATVAWIGPAEKNTEAGWITLVN
jgi:hypothetical protein